MSDLENTLAQALRSSIRRIREASRSLGASQPLLGKADLSYERSEGSDWVEGFWSGQLWLSYAVTKDEFFKQAGRRQRGYFEQRLRRRASLDHDLGFLYMPSVVADYRLTGDRQARKLGLEAADILANRYNNAGKFIPAWTEGTHNPVDRQWSNSGRAVIDTMMNLSLLYWAAAETGKSHYQDIACNHATTTMKHLIRRDGSTYHTFAFDLDTGLPLRGETYQGFSDESCWSRGQAWGMLGFALSFRHTNNRDYLNSALNLADFVIKMLPGMSYVPYWDYRLPEKGPHHRDSSAAAITACGLYELENAVADLYGGRIYKDFAGMILLKLIEEYAVPPEQRAEGLLRHGAADVRRGITDNMLPYGDFFYLEALNRATGQYMQLW